MKRSIPLVRDRATRCMLVMELTRGDDDADFVIDGHEAEVAARVVDGR